MSAAASHRTRVEWMDTDAAGIYHNTAVVRFAESAEAALMREHGLPDYFSRSPRVHYEADFEAPLRFGQDVLAEIRLVRLGRTSMTFEFEVWGLDGDRRTRAAHGSYTTVHLGPDGRSEPWPAEWVEALQRP